MYLETTRAVGASYQFSPKVRPYKRRTTLTAEQIIAQNAFLAQVAASKPKRQGLTPIPVRFR